MRILFPKGEQNKFINKILSFISVNDAAKLCHLSERTIRDWRREKFLADKNAVYILCKRVNIRFPHNVKEKDDYWYAEKGSFAGGIACFKKYGRIGGDAKYAKKKWHEWWKREGKFKSKIIKGCKPINKPKFSEELAEFVGITLGDGGITNRQLTITLNYIDDKEYGKFVASLMKKLFKAHVGIFFDKKGSVNRYSISRTELIRFCTEKLGLKKGDKIKQQIDIPDWIKRNKLYSIACLRGLVDTDGCVFNHHYVVNKKSYFYKKLAFTSYSEPLRKSVYNILKNIGLNPRLYSYRDVRIDSKKDMEMYFKLINSHNPKHLNKWKK
jgi:hypothetical protein